MIQENLYSIQPSAISGLSDDEVKKLNKLLYVWQIKLSRNKLKKEYYEGKNPIKNLGIAIPPDFTNIDMVVGWPAKAVDSLAVRSSFDGFTFAGDENEDISAIIKDNDFKNLYHEATTSELIHSCSFLTVSKGGSNEPDVLLNAYSALNAAAIWNFRTKRIDCGICIVDISKDKLVQVPTWVNFYTSDYTIEIKRDSNDRWRVTNRHKNPHKRPLMEPLVYRPTLDRPFGKSRISRAVMSITDSAVRTALRTEIASELYTAPQKFLLGVDEGIFDNQSDESEDGENEGVKPNKQAIRKSKFEAYYGSIFAVTPNENGDIPQFGQLSQMTMQPHTDYMRSLAARFSGETGIPISSLGVIHDNPASAEAIHAEREDLIIEAESLNATNGNSLRNIGLLVTAIQQGKSVFELTDEEKSITPNFKSPDRPSVVSQADAISKHASMLPWLTETRVILEKLGYNEEEIERLLTEKRKAEGRNLIYQIRGATNAQNTETNTGNVQPGDSGAIEPGEEPASNVS